MRVVIGAGLLAAGGLSACTSSRAPALEASPPLASVQAPLLSGPRAPALFIVAGLHGFTEPCGCTEEILHGGIDRLVGTIDALAAELPMHATIATGDTFFRSSQVDDADHAQDQARVPLIARSLRAAGVQALGVGPKDFARGVPWFLNAVQNEALPLVSTNIEAAIGPFAPTFREVALRGAPVVVFSVIGQSAWDEMGAPSELLYRDPATSLHEVLRESLHELNPSALRVVLFHGSEDEAGALLRAGLAVDVIVPAGSSEETSAVSSSDHRFLVRTWSQGRALGVLRLSAPPGARGPWSNARPYTNEDREQLRALIGTVDEQLTLLRAQVPEGDEPPMIMRRLMERRAGYEASLREAEASERAEFDGHARQFLWDAIALAPGLPSNPTVEADRVRYNRTLQALNLAHAQPPLPIAEGTAGYVGSAMCAHCHGDAHALWETTAHAGAWATLVERDKNFDRECIGCHLTGYNEPGGSTLGFTEGLENVQCESCHGPGSVHIGAPTERSPFGIHREPSASTCTSCHNAEHSPRFDFDAYLPRVLGPGHGEERGSSLRRTHE